MAPSLFPKKDFSRTLNDSNGYGHLFIDRIRGRGWDGLVYDNTDNVFYCEDLIKKFYESINLSTINLDQH